MSPAMPATLERPHLAPLVEALDEVVRHVRTPSETAAEVAAALRANLPGPDILSPRELEGDPDNYAQHILHVDPEGAYSIVALVWLEGQQTPVHDHVSWCVVGVVHGTESEVVYEPGEDESGPYLFPVATGTNQVGSVCAFAPPGDIHLVRNQGPGVAVSIHVYGADISRLGSSIRRSYRQPVRPVSPAPGPGGDA